VGFAHRFCISFQHNIWPSSPNALLLGGYVFIIDINIEVEIAIQIAQLIAADRARSYLFQRLDSVLIKVRSALARLEYVCGLGSEGRLRKDRITLVPKLSKSSANLVEVRGSRLCGGLADRLLSRLLRFDGNPVGGLLSSLLRFDGDLSNLLGKRRLRSCEL
jgi:hypothetical protein